MSETSKSGIATFFENIARIQNDVLAFQKQYTVFVEKTVETIKKISLAADGFPEIVGDVVYIMGSQGWFMGLDAPFVGQMEVVEALRKGDCETADKALKAYYQKKAPQLLSKLKDRYPGRSEIWDASFKAHFRGEYILSIPVFLAQADGLWQEGMGHKLYKKKTGNKIYSKEVKTRQLSDILLASLEPALPINLDYDPLLAEFTNLNRHQVLHGKSINYGTELNSLKAISLLDFVADVVEFAVERKKG